MRHGFPRTLTGLSTAAVLAALSPTSAPGPATAATPERAVSASSASAASFAQPDPGLLGIRLLDAPVVRRDDPRALTYIVDHLEPGTTIERHVEISNKTPLTREVKLYPAAATITENRFTFAEGQQQNALTGWTTIQPGHRKMGPYERFTATVRIKVPVTAKPGERYAVLWAESASQPKSGDNIGIISRAGIRTYLDVANGGEYSDFRVDKVSAALSKKGRPQVVARVQNTGKRAVDLEGKLDLEDGPGALKAGPYHVTPGTTLPPGGRGTVTVNVGRGLPAGPWTGRLQLRSGEVRHSVTAKLTFPQAPGTTVSAQLLKAAGNSTWYLAAGGAAVLLVLAVLLRRRSRRRGRTGAAS
ncbi:peptidase [Streptomyces boluensis]|uniref:Peptidase n=1 Tax=Streptomyces boluensis TaxID=1775135 RepID=A0A964UUM4_9ACTN|nr:peptidase [Streptomyces boluensis]NBE54508.1 peptidase [Streptomyces boluensis]